MFGDDQNNTDNQAAPISTQPVNDGLLGINNDQPATNTPSSAPTVDPSIGDASSTDTPTLDTSTSQDNSAVAPENSTDTADTSPTEDISAPESNTDASNTTADPVSDSFDTDSASNTSSDDSASDNELLDIKRQALQDLSPLVDKLDQTPDEKFKTTMMMIQATDSQALVPKAYEAAKAIDDEKERAQALLDIVNEINYFTQKHED